jgi:hypothetical protein
MSTLNENINLDTIMDRIRNEYMRKFPDKNIVVIEQSVAMIQNYLIDRIVITVDKNGNITSINHG